MARSSKLTARTRTARARIARARIAPLLRLIEHGFAALGLLFLVYHLGFDLSVMASPSMSPALRGTSAEPGDWVLAERISYLFRRPRRWEVVAFRNNGGTNVMKRVVGLPGEAVSLADNCVVVNGSAAARPASIAGVKYYAYGNLARNKPAACGDGYYVLGDDSQDSEDSRFEGPVGPDRIRGRAWLIVWPLSRIGFVNP
jgi:signal peptidase I